MSNSKHTNVKNFIKYLRILTFFISLLGLLFYVRAIYVKWYFDPDILKTERMVPSNTVPLPAITICSPVVASRSHETENSSAELSDLFWHMCDLDSSQDFYDMAPNDTFFRNPVKLLEKFSPEMSQTTLRCTVRGERKECRPYLTRVLTDFGFCYTANMMNPEEILNMNTISDDFKLDESLKGYK